MGIVSIDWFKGIILIFYYLFWFTVYKECNFVTLDAF